MVTFFPVHPSRIYALVSHLLSVLSERQGNDNCNDFDLAAFIPDEDERRDFVRAFHEYNGDPEEFDPKLLTLPNFAVAGFLASMFRQKQR